MTKSLELTSFFDKDFKFWFNEISKTTDTKFLNEMFNDKEIKYLKSHFNKYFDFIIENSSENRSKKLFLEWRQTLEYYFLIEVYHGILFSPTYKFSKSNPELFSTEILRVLHRLFFFSNLTLACLIGNLENYTIRVRKAGRLIHPLSNQNIELYREVWGKIEELNLNFPVRNVRRACIKISSIHPENREDYENDDRLYKRFNKFMKENKINSLSDYLLFLSTIGK